MANELLEFVIVYLTVAKQSLRYMLTEHIPLSLHLPEYTVAEVEDITVKEGHLGPVF